MSFKTNRPTGHAPALHGFSLLGFSGPDAGAFLQAQTMNDVQALTGQQWQWNGWLNPKGRVIALFALLRLGEEDLLAVLPDFPAHELLPMLQRYVFRSKVRLRVVTDLVATAEFGSPTDDQAPRDHAVGDLQSGLSLDFSGHTSARSLILSPAGSPSSVPADAACDAEWLRLDLAHGLPRLSASQRESWTPQMLSLDRLNAFSLKKGCYPGQEIVARTHYLGQARRSSSRVLGRNLQQGATLLDAQGAVIGNMICVTPDGINGLAVVQSEKCTGSAWIEGQAVTLPAFLDGFARPV